MMSCLWMSVKKIFVWIGSGASVEERTKATDLAQRHLKKLHREGTTVTPINQGEEPASFTSLFGSWDPDLWENISTYSDVKRRVDTANNEL